MSVPFVGRQHELDTLLALSRRAGAERRPAAAIVTGQPGSGKTRLLMELLQQSRDIRQVRVVGYEPIQPIPLAAISELLRQLAKVPVHGARLETAHHGPDSGDPGKGDGCYVADGNPALGQDDQNPAIK